MHTNAQSTVESLVADPFAKREAVASENRRKILDFQARMALAIESGEAQGRDFDLVHTFTEGAYARQISIPKGSLIVGKIHRHAHLNFVMSGHVSVMTDEGVKEINGPVMFVSRPGTKRVVFAHEDTVWVTVHVTEETDLQKVEEQIIAKSFDDLGLLVAPPTNAMIKES